MRNMAGRAFSLAEQGPRNHLSGDYLAIEKSYFAALVAAVSHFLYQGRLSL
jgi:hypothetical protein